MTPWKDVLTLDKHYTWFGDKQHRQSWRKDGAISVKF